MLVFRNDEIPSSFKNNIEKYSLSRYLLQSMRLTFMNEKNMYLLYFTINHFVFQGAVHFPPRGAPTVHHSPRHQCTRREDTTGCQWDVTG